MCGACALTLPYRSVITLWKGLGGETLSAHERASRLDALQSSLHGLGEVLSKRVIVDRAARREAEALGGPAILASLLGDGSDQGGEGAAATAAAAAADADMSGWLTGSQLKAFEKEVQGRCVWPCCAVLFGLGRANRLTSQTYRAGGKR